MGAQQCLLCESTSPSVAGLEKMLGRGPVLRTGEAPGSAWPGSLGLCGQQRGSRSQQVLAKPGDGPVLLPDFLGAGLTGQHRTTKACINTGLCLCAAAWSYVKVSRSPALASAPGAV